MIYYDNWFCIETSGQVANIFASELLEIVVRFWRIPRVQLSRHSLPRYEMPKCPELWASGPYQLGDACAAFPCDVNRRSRLLKKVGKRSKNLKLLYRIWEL